MANIFPLIPDLQEQIDNINASTSTMIESLGRVLKIDFETNQFVVQDGELVELTDDVEKIEQWIKAIFHAYKDKYIVYKDTEFYCNIEDFIGKKINANKGYYMSELAREIRTALLKNKYVSSVDNFLFSNDHSKTNVAYNVTLIDGTVLSKSEVI